MSIAAEKDSGLVLLYRAANSLEAYTLSIHLKANYVAFQMKDDASSESDDALNATSSNKAIQIFVSGKDKDRAARVLNAKGYRHLIKPDKPQLALNAESDRSTQDSFTFSFTNLNQLWKDNKAFYFLLLIVALAIVALIFA